MDFKIIKHEVLSSLLLNEDEPVSKKTWRNIAITNAYIILGMVLAKNIDLEELKEMISKLNCK